MLQEVTIPCGRYDFNQETKKVVIVKAKGLLNLYLNDENELWLKWYNVDLESKLEIERILIKGCTFFEKVKGQNRVYLLRFTDDDQKYFFWMQSDDQTQDENYCKQFNDIINSQVLDDPIQIQQQPPVQFQPHTQPSQQQIEQQQQQIVQQQEQLIKLLSQQLTQMVGPGLSLTDILSSEFLTQIGKDEEYFQALKEYLPPDQQSFEQFKENLLSPQFKQALDQLTHALKGRERSSVIQQLDLDYKVLEQEFDGVVAFIKAIMRKDQNKN